MRCSNCQHENQPSAKFCQECATPLPQVCSSCGATLPQAAKFCPQCAHPVAAPQHLASPGQYTPKHLAEKILTSKSALEGERKQVTVLFCDIANSTALAAKVGAEAMHGVLSRFFESALAEVHRYEGTINQFLGDGFMALFGAPIAHEDHARRAVLSALGIRSVFSDGADDILVRIGINTGPVVVGKIGDNLRMDYTAVGDTTNMSARLEQSAKAGQILISDTTERLVRGYVTCQALAPLAVKGKSEPIAAFEVLSPGRRRSRLDDNRVLSPFVGRDRELDILREALAEAERGQGQVVGIMGEPGLGKSRLLYEFRRWLQERDVTYLEGWCLSFGQSTPYLPLQDLLRTICEIGMSDVAAQIGEKIRVVLARAGLPAEDRAPYLLKALGIREGTQTLEDVSPENVMARTLETLQTLVLAQSKQRTLVLAIEDLHWIDKTSEEFLARLIEDMPGARIQLVTTTRPGYSPPWLGKSYVTQLPLRVLSSDAARRLVGATVERTAMSDSVTDAILGKAEGNPFFLEELTQALLERHDLPSARALPDTIQGVLAARIDRLPEEVKRTLQTAAVLGREFSPRLLAAISPGASDLSKHLAALKQLEFLYERAEADGHVYTFKHALTQEVAYEGLLTSRREALHEAAGRAIEAFYPDRLEEHYELLAHHFSHSAAHDKALDYLEFANRKAIKANAVFDAKDFFEQAMRVLDALADNDAYRHRRIALIAAQVDVFILTNQLDQYESCLERFTPVAQSLSDQGLQGAFLSSLGHCQFGLARPLQAIQTLGPAAELCERAGNFESAGRAYVHLQWSHLLTGEFEEAISFEAPTLAALARAPNARLRLYAFGASSWAYSRLGRWDQAIEKARTALAECEAAGDASLISTACWVRSLAYIHNGDVESALTHAKRGFDGAATLGDRGWAQLGYGWAMIPHSPRRSIELLAPLVPMWLGRWWFDVVALVALGEAYLGAGEFVQARATLEQAIEVAQPRGMLFKVAPAQRLLGEVFLAMNSLDESEMRFEAAIALLGRFKAENELALARAGYGRLLQRLGRVSEARDYFDRALETFERLGTLNQSEKLRDRIAALPVD